MEAVNDGEKRAHAPALQRSAGLSPHGATEAHMVDFYTRMKPCLFYFELRAN